MTRLSRTTVSAAYIAMAALFAVSCTTTHTSHAGQLVGFRPSVTATKCPADIDDVLIGTYSCSYLTVREGGSDPTRTIQLLVTQVQPADGVKHSDPVIVVGENFATPPYYPGIAPLADRVGRTVIFLDMRGVGHSRPALDCPEVDSLGPSTLAASTADPTSRQRFLAAIRACHDRLAKAPLDLSAYNVANAAGDVVALAQALRLTSWNVGSWGSSSRVALELLQRDHPGLRAMFLDSPELPADDPRLTAASDTEAALGRLLAACTRATTCHHLSPGSAANLDRLFADLDQHPITSTVHTTTSLTVRFDGAMTLRFVRYMLAQNGAGCCPDLTAGAVPAFLDALRHRQGGRLDHLIAGLTGDQPYCEGYVPSCAKFHSITTGAYLSALCHDLQPFSHPESTAGSTGTGGWSAAFGGNPWLDVCGSWRVNPARRAPADRIASDIPILAFIGAFDPFANVARVQAALSGVTHHYVLTSPVWGHNVFGSGSCATGIRSAWLDSPQEPPDAACLAKAADDFTFRRRL